MLLIKNPVDAIIVECPECGLKNALLKLIVYELDVVVIGVINLASVTVVILLNIDVSVLSISPVSLE